MNWIRRRLCCCCRRRVSGQTPLEADFVHVTGDAIDPETIWSSDEEDAGPSLSVDALPGQRSRVMVYVRHLTPAKAGKAMDVDQVSLLVNAFGRATLVDQCHSGHGLSACLLECGHFTACELQNPVNWPFLQTTMGKDYCIVRVARVPMDTDRAHLLENE